MFTLRSFAQGLGRWIRRTTGAWFVWAGIATAGEPPWPPSVYSYFADGARLEAVLGEFAAGFNLTLSIQPGVTGVVSGRFTSTTPSEFLTRLGGVYGFVWYTHAGILHVSRSSDVVMRSIAIPPGGITNLRATLTELGVVDPRFGWGELPGYGILMVSGPERYVNLIEETLRQLPVGVTSGRQLRVFRLRHASAEDRSIRYRDQQITQPGLATVLRAILAPGGVQGVLGEGSVEVQPTVPLPPVGGTSDAASAAASRASARSRSPDRSAALGPAIQSDPRLNALIVSDVPEMMPTYERLIAQLDVPSALIEIEAMIIDVNTERARELGINWSLRNGDFSASFGGGTLGLALGSSGGSASTLPANGGNQLVAQIRLLEKVGDARIQSRPSVLTTDNIGALLDLSETFYIRLQGERVASVSPVTAGTTLKVTPRLVPGEQQAIQLTVDIEDGQIQDRQVDSLPTVRRSNVSTQAVVRPGETLMIAGYSADQHIDTDQKVPFLGDLPGLGALFSNKIRTVQKRERLFLIRPKLVPPGTASPSGEAPG